MSYIRLTRNLIYDSSTDAAFTVTANEPVTVDVQVIGGQVTCLVYAGDSIDDDVEPIGGYDSAEVNVSWHSFIDATGERVVRRT